MKRLALVVFSVFTFLSLYSAAQERERIAAGVAIPVRTSEFINSKRADGRIYHGTVEADVTDDRGGIAIHRGAQVELIVRDGGHREFILDLESVTVEGRRYAIAADAVLDVNRKEKDGVGGNERTAKYVGGGAVLGTIIGAIAGGGKGAAIGAVSGAAAGAGSQMVTRGKELKIPSESVVTFRLEQPLVIREKDHDRDRDRR